MQTVLHFPNVHRSKILNHDQYFEFDAKIPIRNNFDHAGEVCRAKIHTAPAVSAVLANRDRKDPHVRLTGHACHSTPSP